MAAKRIDIPGIGTVTFTKRASSRSIRLRVTPKGVHVSLPRWSTYRSAVQFVSQHTDWITEKQRTAHPAPPLEHGMKIGKQHTLRFETVPRSEKVLSRVTATRVLVRVHPNEDISDESVQQRAVAAAKRALKKEALQLLPPRVEAMSREYAVPYNSINAKELTRRWGSCDSHKNLIFSIYLMQLPWSQIDYVIAHELTHTIHLNHSPAFWQALERLYPHARGTAKLVRHTQPALTPTQSATAFEDDMAY